MTFLADFDIITSCTSITIITGGEDVEKEGFKMYAVKIDEPYIVKEKDRKHFEETSQKQKGQAENLSKIFNKKCFDFQPDENGILKVSLDVDNEN